MLVSIYSESKKCHSSWSVFIERALERIGFVLMTCSKTGIKKCDSHFCTAETDHESVSLFLSLTNARSEFGNGVDHATNDTSSNDKEGIGVFKVD